MTSLLDDITAEASIWLDTAACDREAGHRLMTELI